MDAKIKKVFDSFPLFAKNFIYITDNNNDVVKFELNDAQIEIEELMLRNRFIIVGKARQSGISTFTLGRALWRALTKENENILIVSYKLDSAKALFEKLKQMNDYIPRDRYPDLFAKVKRDNRDELVFSNGSKIKSVTAGNKDVGRGSTYTYIHLSEYAFYANQEKQLLSVEQSLAKGSESQLTIETTSNGTGNHFYRLYMQAMKNKSKYVAYFVPFYHKLYAKQFAHDYMEAVEWYKANNNGEKLTENDLDEEEQALHKLGATLTQLTWRRWKMLDLDSESDFYQEYPSNPLESFISTGNAVFNQTKVLNRLTYANEPIDKREVRSNLPETIRQWASKGIVLFDYPKVGKKYYFGVDTASGSGGNNDSSTIVCFDDEGQQVLSFESNKIAVYEFAELIDVLGRWYNYAFLVVERNSYGLPVIERLRKELGYINMYKQKLFDERGKRKLQLGWTTTQGNKAIFISDMKEQFEKSLVNIECKQLLQQMQLFIENSGKMGNKRGNTEKN
ncbi:terminase large subunit domain-containing protein, partial [Lysinibacillus sp. NPDC098008]|uniref:terminase large subunit domain-containing protein n=1 Tax=Lysinibacillus sp. NPDC098008 TaxID=3364146 RepID=UPI00380D7DEC